MREREREKADAALQSQTHALSPTTDYFHIDPPRFMNMYVGHV